MVAMLAMSMSAKTVATVEKLWSGDVLGWNTGNTRQWSGYGEYVYWADKATTAIVGTKDGVKVDTVIVNEKIDGTAFCVDGAGNWVVEGTFPSNPSHIFLVKRADTTFVDIAIEGVARTDIATATGDVFSAEGGFVFLYGNSTNTLDAPLLVYAIKNAGTEAQEVILKTIAIKGSNVQNFVVAGDTIKQYVMRRSSGQTGFDLYENGENKGSIEGLTGYKHTTLGGAMLTLAGKDIAIYPVGAVNYSSEFSVANLTDGALAVDKADATKTTFYANTTTKANSTNVGVFVNATKIDDNSAYIQVGNGSDGTALFKLEVLVAAEVTLTCDENQGTVTGGGDIAVGANATVEATPKPGYEFVAWKKGEEVVSNDAKYIFKVEEDIALTAVFEAKENVTITLAVNDAELGAITMPEGIQLGANSVVYGTPLTLTAVPVEGATFMGWFKGEELFAAAAELKLDSKESISLTAKFVKALVLAYELNGGVANDYKWYTPSDMFADFMFDAQGKAAPHTLEEYLAMPEKLGDPGICVALTTPEKAFENAEKWGWLKTYIASVHAAQAADGASALPDNGAGAAWRYAVGAFFIDGQREGWPKSANFATCGVSTIEAYQKVWKHGFANPTEVTAEFTLNAPYQAGFTFDGWYPDAEFAGEKVLKVAPESKIEGNKLYAKWVEYIPSLAEVIALAENEETNARGVVTYINNKNAYIQDASAGMLLFCKDAPTFKVGDLVVVKGTRTVYGGAPELKNVVEVRAEASTMPKAVPLPSLAAATADPLKYFGQLISFNGLKITALDSYKNPSLTDGVDTVVCYKMSVDDTKLPVGTVVNVTAIAGYYNGFQLVGDPAGIVEAGGAGKDAYAYPALGEKGEYTLTNKWLYSNILDNYASAMPSQSDFARGMVAKDGKMYFINRVNGSFTVVDGANGKKLDPIQITGEHLFQALDTTDQTYKDCATLKFNDVKLDQAGNFLIGGCVSGGNRMQVYKVDIATGAATVVVDDHLYDYKDFELEGQATAWRFDAFNVYGDVNNKAIVMAADANSFYVYYWEIENGVAGPAQRINCTPEATDVSLIVKDGAPTVTAFGTAPQIFPVDFDYFYVDGWNTLPMLFDMDGTLVQDFAAVPSGVKVPMANDTCTMNTGHNGLCEFQVGNEYYLIMAATNTVGTPTSAFALYKFADENKEFSEMTPMWFFPADGMGAATNGCRTAVPSVEVKDNVATLYVYTNNNGYGVYEMTGVLGGDAVVNVGQDAAIKAEKLIENGNLFIIRNGVRYNAQGIVAQ